MKYFLTTLLLVLGVNTSYAQSSLYKVCEKKLDKILQDDNLIDLNSTKKKEKDFAQLVKEKIYGKLLPSPSAALNKNVVYAFEGKSIGKIFSTAYTGTLSPIAIESTTSVSLPSPTNSLSIYLLKRDVDNYKFNLNASATLAQVLNSGGDFNAGVVASKASNTLKNSLSSQSSLTLFYGQFANNTSKIFEKIEREKSVSVTEWNPLFEILFLHFKDANFKRTYGNYKIVDQFYGLISSSTKKYSIANSNQIDSELKMNYSYMGLAGLKADYDLNWGKAKSGTKEEEAFDVYMINDPEYPVKTIALPKIANILASWKSLSNNIARVIYPENESFYSLKPDNSAEATILFGPVPLEYADQIRCIPKNALVNSITDFDYGVVDINDNVKGSWKVTFNVLLNSLQVNTIQSAPASNEFVTRDIQFRCSIGNDTAGLFHDYSGKVKIDLRPFPKTRQDKYVVGAPKITDSKRQFKIPVQIKFIQSGALSVSNIKFESFTFNDQALTNKLTFRASPSVTTVENDYYKDTIYINDPGNHINNENLIQNLKFNVRFTEGTNPYVKPVSIELQFPEMRNSNATNYTVRQDIKSTLTKEIDLSKIDSAITVVLPDSTYQLTYLLAEFRKHPEAEKIIIGRREMETSSLILALSDALHRNNILKPVAPNQKGVLLENRY